MATYKVEINKLLMRTYTISVPDYVAPEDAKEWCEDNAPDLWDVEKYDGLATWDVNDLEDGKEVTVSVKCDFDDDDEYEVDGFYPWTK